MRAFAVLAVVVYHALPAVLPGGFIGVDIFFVISGYLISGQIFGELREGQFNLAAFYGRRIRRIFPALAVVLLATLSYGFVILLPSELAELGGDVAAGAGFAANLMLWQEAGYFDRAAMLKPLLHLWSLGVEEQFYVVWPITLWALYRAGWLRPWLLAGLAGASFVLSAALAGLHPAADFYSPYTRFWELAAGALLAWTQRPGTFNRPGTADAISLVGLLLLLSSLVLLNAEMEFPGWLAAVPVLGAVLLLGAGPEAWVNRNLFSRRVAVRAGLLSYPFYLWHWPLISYAHFLNEDQPLKTFPAICIIVAALGLAAVTYQWLERPLRFGGAKRSKTIFLSAVMLVTGGFGAATWAEHGFPGRFPPLPNVDINKINAAVRDGIFKPTPHMRVMKLDGITVDELGDTGSAIMFTGDSVLFQWGPRVEALLNEGRLRHRVYFVVGPSCRPFPGVSYAPAFEYCAELAKVQKQVIREDHIGTIVIGASWQRAFGGAPSSETKLYADIKDELAAWVQQGFRVYLILPTPIGISFDPGMMVRHRLTGFDVDQANLKGVPLAQLEISMTPISEHLKALALQAGAKTLDPLTDICGNGPICSPFFAAGEPKFSDPEHLRPIFVESDITFLDQILIH